MTMIGRIGMRAMLAAALAAGAYAVTLNAQEPRKGLGQRLENAGQAIKQGAENLGEDVRDGVSRARASVDNMGVAGRVYGRLRWDKALVGSAIDIDVRDGGSTVLRGTVATAAAKKKAVELAADTVGVTEVVNDLAIRPAPTVTPAPAAAPR